MFDNFFAIAILAVVITWLACRYTKRRAMLHKLDGIAIRNGHYVAMNGSNPRNPACPLCQTRHIKICVHNGRAQCDDCGSLWVVSTGELEKATRNHV